MRKGNLSMEFSSKQLGCTVSCPSLAQCAKSHLRFMQGQGVFVSSRQILYDIQITGLYFHLAYEKKLIDAGD